MKRLNNRGWSIGTMVAFICIFFFFILIIGIIAYNFGVENASRDSNSSIEETNDY